MKGLVVPEEEADYTADPVELFFDLAYVFAFSQLVSVLVHHPDWEHVGEASLVFTILWMTWSQLTWAGNAVPGNLRPARLFFLFATATSVPMAASVSTAFDDSGLLFAIPVVVIATLGLGLALEGARETIGRAQGKEFAASIVVFGALMIVGGIVDGGARVGLWVAAVVVYLAGAARTTETDWMLRAGHFAERHGLIIIVALGEVIVAVGKPLVESLEEGEGVSGEAVVALSAAGVFACVLWWAYFDRVQPALEHRVEATTGPARSTLARDDYTFFHLPVVAGVIAAAAGLEEITLHPDEPLPLAFRTMLFGGLALFLGGVGIAAFRTFGAIARERLLAIAAMALLLFVATDVNGVWLIVGINLILLVTLTVEHVRIERPGPGVTADAEPATAR
ncbi:MAG: low temperature requirement protein A [Actinomycetota bacterium]